MDIQGLRGAAIRKISEAKDLEALETVRIEYLGRERGKLTAILRSLGDLPLEERKKIGPAANVLRDEIDAALKQKFSELKTSASGGNSLNLKASPVDITIPTVPPPRGHLHPLTIIDRRVREIFSSLGFSIVEGPEVEYEHYNFNLLNIPAEHPARDMWDTFWLDSTQVASGGKKLGRALLRTHTSPMQVRYMERHKPPFQIIVPGRVFRFEATDSSHEINFHQVEGLMVGPDVNLGHFKYVIQSFFNALFGKEVNFRLRPHYFPFTEPSLEVDVEWNGKWLEMIGAGMVHSQVFRAAGYDPKTVRGFAFGLGLDRLAMIKYKIPDVRMLYSGDLRFISQF